MKFDKATILLCIVIALSVWTISRLFPPKRNNDDLWKNEIKHLEQDKKELQVENSGLKDEVKELEAEIDRKDSLYEIKKSTIEYRIKNIPTIINATPVNDVLDAAEKRFGKN